MQPPQPLSEELSKQLSKQLAKRLGQLLPKLYPLPKRPPKQLTKQLPKPLLRESPSRASVMAGAQRFQRQYQRPSAKLGPIGGVYVVRDTASSCGGTLIPHVAGQADRRAGEDCVRAHEKGHGAVLSPPRWLLRGRADTPVLGVWTADAASAEMELAPARPGWSPVWVRCPSPGLTECVQALTYRSLRVLQQHQLNPDLHDPEASSESCKTT